VTARRHTAITVVALSLLFAFAGCARLDHMDLPGQLSTQAVPALLDPLTVPQFINPLPNPLDPSFVFAPSSGSHYDIGVYQTQQNLLGPGFPATTVWGYGYDGAPSSATFPGRTFEVERDQQITVTWYNHLVDGSGDPLPHLLPVDTSVHWAFDDAPGATLAGDGVPIVAHLHGGHTRADSDGNPDAWFTPDFGVTGALFNQDYVYDNDQEAATLWYHDHTMGITRLNVYAGLAGFYLIRDDNERDLNLPEFPNEIPLVIQDRMFTSDAQLYLPSQPPVPEVITELSPPDPSVQPEFFGNVILVNGVAWPFTNVEPRKYRLRFLNGSDSRFYDLRLQTEQDQPGPALTQIGSDDGLLEAPVPLESLVLAPGERADVIVDFSDPALWNHVLVMKNTAREPYPKGTPPDPLTAGRIMVFRVVVPLEGADSTPLPTDLRPIYGIIDPLTATAPNRRLLLFEAIDEYGRLKPSLGTVTDGIKAYADPVTETIGLGDTEIWEIYNTTVDAHPIHLHLVSFQILDRQKFTATQDPTTGAFTSPIRTRGQAKAPPANEAGWKDTVVAYPGEVTRVIAHFDRPGEYVWHCHILSHEDHEMMRPFTVED